MLSHGICSSGLFYGLNLVYERCFTRRMLLVKGIILLIPIYSYWWFSLRAGNIGCPPSFNFLSELILSLMILRYSFFSMVFVGILLLIGGIYRVYLFILITHGNFLNVGIARTLNRREYLVFFVHRFPIYFILLKINIFF